MGDYTVVFWLTALPGGFTVIHELDGFETQSDARQALVDLRTADIRIVGAVIARPYTLPH